MGLDFQNLDGETRAYMLEEIDMDLAAGNIYISNYLNDHGAVVWVDLLRFAVQDGTDDSLAAEIRNQNCLKFQVERRKPGGGYTMAKVPITAPSTMAEGEFNRFYVRGLCRRAIANGIPQLEVYRAKPVDVPRPESQAKLGMMVDPQVILNDLRATTGVEPALGLPPGPNSGLTLRLPINR